LANEEQRSYVATALAGARVNADGMVMSGLFNHLGSEAVLMRSAGDFLRGLVATPLLTELQAQSDRSGAQEDRAQLARALSCAHADWLMAGDARTASALLDQLRNLKLTTDDGRTQLGRALELSLHGLSLTTESAVALLNELDEVAGGEQATEEQLTLLMQALAYRYNRFSWATSGVGPIEKNVLLSKLLRLTSRKRVTDKQVALLVQSLCIAFVDASKTDDADTAARLLTELRRLVAIPQTTEEERTRLVASLYQACKHAQSNENTASRNEWLDELRGQAERKEASQQQRTWLAIALVEQKWGLMTAWEEATSAALLSDLSELASLALDRQTHRTQQEPIVRALATAHMAAYRAGDLKSAHTVMNELRRLAAQGLADSELAEARELYDARRRERRSKRPHPSKDA
jgi:hypothetical protein